ncbi:unnamed protein product [Diamesa serratosioi]
MDKAKKLESEKLVLLSSWENLDNIQLCKDVATKGKYLNMCVNFLATKRLMCNPKEAQNFFFQQVHIYVKNMIKNRQIHRAIHVLNNVDIKPIYFFYQLWYSETDETFKRLIYDEVLTSQLQLQDEKDIKGYFLLYTLITTQSDKFASYIEVLNKKFNINSSIENLTFEKFKKHPIEWQQKLAVDVFFKTKNAKLKVCLQENKHAFWSYLLKDDLHTLLKSWIQEQYFCQTGNTSGSNENMLFEDLLIHLFRTWKLDKTMVDELAQRSREKDVILNELAKLNFFIPKEQQNVSKQLQRLFSSGTFQENFCAIKKDQLTKYVIENNLLDVLIEDFIDHDYLQSVLTKTQQDGIFIKEEIKLIEQTMNLLSSKTSAEEFVQMSKDTSEYLHKDTGYFNDKHKIVLLMEKTFDKFVSKEDEKVFATNAFTASLSTKLNDKDDSLLSVDQLLQKYHSIDIKYIQRAFKDGLVQQLPTFECKKLSKYGKRVELNYIDYLYQLRSSYGVYSFVIGMLKNSSKINNQQMLKGCESVAKMAINQVNDRELVAHCIAFIEMLSVDTTALRSILRLVKLYLNSKRSEEIDSVLNEIVVLKDETLYFEEFLKNIEALEFYYSHHLSNDLPSRYYLNKFLVTNDWLRIVMLSQYLDYPLHIISHIIDNEIKDINLRNNLLRAIIFDSSPELKKRASFSNRHRSNNKKKELNDLFTPGLFLEMKRDVFAVLLSFKTTEKIHMEFKDYQKFFTELEFQEDSLLRKSIKMEWPLLSVIAGITRLYRLKFCWITWLVVSSDFPYNKCYEDIAELVGDLFNHCFLTDHIRTFKESLEIFYPETPLLLFTEFLWRTKDGQFDDSLVHLYKKFIIKLQSKNYNLLFLNNKEDTLKFIFSTIMCHLKLNFQTLFHQHLFLSCLCQSIIGYFNDKIDFIFLRNLCYILQKTKIKLNFELFGNVQKRTSFEVVEESKRICEELVKENNFNAALDAASMFGLSKGQILYSCWLNDYEKNCYVYHNDQYTRDIVEHKIKPDLLVKFYLNISQRLETSESKYTITKRILETIKHYGLQSNDFFDRDVIEYDLILLYVKLKSLFPSIELDPYYSEFFEMIISKERYVIYNSFLDLKRIAKIDDLTVSARCLTVPEEIEALDSLINHLLDVGDIIEVLRIQEMFDRKPNDLSFLVYCMALAEKLVTIYDLPRKERQLIFETSSSASKQFNKFTLRMKRSSFHSISTSPGTDADMNESFSVDSVSKDDKESFNECKDIFEAIQGLASKIRHGGNLASRVVLMFRISLYLDRNYVELIRTKNTFQLLQIAADSDCQNKLMIMMDIIIALHMKNDEVAEFISKEITASIIRSRFYMLKSRESITTSMSISRLSPHKDGSAVDNSIWGYSLENELHLIMELSPSTTLLGNYLLKYYEIISVRNAVIPFYSQNADLDRICCHLNEILKHQMLSLKKQNVIRVDLLIYAHACFANECSTEGIGSVLQKSRVLCNILTAAKSWHLIVRLLCGVGRYQEMYYCFDILIANDQFESLLGQFCEKSTNGMKASLLAYLKEYHPFNKEYFRMTCSHFMLWDELAVMWQEESQNKINQILIREVLSGKTVKQQTIDIPYLKPSKQMIIELYEIVDEIVHASELYLLENKIDLAMKIATSGELVAMQIHLLKLKLNAPEELCVSILKVKDYSVFEYIVNYELNVPQAMILSRAYRYEIDFVKCLYAHVITSGEETYLKDFVDRLDVTDEMIESLVTMFQLETVVTKDMEKTISQITEMVLDTRLKYKLASLLGLKHIIGNIINSNSVHYLKDNLWS